VEIIIQNSGDDRGEGKNHTGVKYGRWERGKGGVDILRYDWNGQTRLQVSPPTSWGEEADSVRDNLAG
jgi:hypothetical protein